MRPFSNKIFLLKLILYKHQSSNSKSSRSIVAQLPEDYPPSMVDGKARPQLSPTNWSRSRGAN